MEAGQVDLTKKKSDWESFIRKARTKTANHTAMVRFYNALYNFMILTVILLAGILTCLILLGGIQKPVLASLSGACTILTAMSKFLIADRKKAGHKRYAKIFQNLLIRMLKCECIKEYNAMWSELQENIIKSPLVLIWRRENERAKIPYNMPYLLEQAFLGKDVSANPPYISSTHHPPYSHGSQQQYYNSEQRHNDIEQGYDNKQHGYDRNQNIQATRGNGQRPNSFNPHDFHVMSVQDPATTREQQTPSKTDGYMNISGLKGSKNDTDENQGHVMDELPGDEKMPFLGTLSKGKKKKKKSDSERARQSYSSQGTLDEIDEVDEKEMEWDDPQNDVINDMTSLTKAKKAKKKKGNSSQSKKDDEDLPPPPVISEEEDDYKSQGQQIRLQHKSNGSGMSKGLRSTASMRNNRPIVYDEEEENGLSEESDD